MTALEAMIKQADAKQAAERRAANFANKTFYAFAYGGFLVGIAAGIAAIAD